MNKHAIMMGYEVKIQNLETFYNSFYLEKNYLYSFESVLDSFSTIARLEDGDFRIASMLYAKDITEIYIRNNKIKI